MRLFADQGYEATSVGAIERAAGLAPRSGALYQHFASKEALLEATIERELAAVDELPSVIEMLPLGDLRSELMLLGRWNLQSLARRDQLTRFVRRDGHRLPERLRARLYERLVAAPYALVTAWLRGRLEGASAGASVDVDALALVLTESLSAHRGIKTAFGAVPDDVDDDRVLAVWVELCMAYASEVGIVT